LWEAEFERSSPLECELRKTVAVESVVVNGLDEISPAMKGPVIVK
jgi:hypothetical protein